MAEGQYFHSMLLMKNTSYIKVFQIILRSMLRWGTIHTEMYPAYSACRVIIGGQIPESGYARN